MWLDLSPSSLPPLVLADPGFAYQKPKLPPLGVWCPYPEELGLLQALSSSRVPLFLSFTAHRQTNGTVVRSSCHGPMPGGNWRRGRTTQPWATPSQMFGLEQVPMRQKKKKKILHLIKKKANQPFSQKHKAFFPSNIDCSISPIQPESPAAKGLKSGKKATPAGEDLGREGRSAL